MPFELSCNVMPVKPKDISVQLWMVIVFLGIGFVLDIIALALPQWNKHNSETWGLWRRCTDSDCSSIDDSGVLSNAMEVGRAFEVLGLLSYVAMVILMVLYLVWRQFLVLISATILVGFSALFFILIGAILWASSSNTSISWGYYICYPSGLAASAVSGVLLFVRRQALLQKIETQNTAAV